MLDHDQPEFASLLRVLRELAPGRRVLVLGCGDTRRVRALAAGSYEVVTIDASQAALDDARLQAGVAGTSMAWCAHDVSTSEPWPLDEVDAVVTDERFGSRGAVNARTVLRTIRHHLTEDGVLILDDARITGVEPLLRSCGYEILEIDEGRSSVWAAARTVPVAPEALAVSHHFESPAAELDLRWTPDEDDWLDPSPMSIWTRIVGSTPAHAAVRARAYALTDPYGAHRGAGVVSKHFGAPVPEHCVAFGAGGTALLHDLAALADGGVTLTHPLAHPDLPAWARRHGSEVVEAPSSPDLRDLIVATGRIRPALVLVDRPSILGDVPPVTAVRALARAGSAVGATLVVDEAYATYLGPAASCVPLTAEVANLIVVRSLSKGYAWGGLRAGFCVWSLGVARSAIETVTPLGVSALSFDMALELLKAGDIFEPLRARLGEVKPDVVTRLRAIGLKPVGTRPDLPWIALEDPRGEVDSLLTSRGISTRPLLETRTGRTAGWIKLGVPISQERLERFMQLTAG